MPLKTCQFGSCLDDVLEDGISVSLRKPTYEEETRAGYCCAYHAALGLLRLALDRKEVTQDNIRKGIELLPSRWRVT